MTKPKPFFIMAMQTPFFGSSFKALETFSLWNELSRHAFEYSWSYTGDSLPSTTFARLAHIVYFQVPGTRGFVDLFFYLACLFAFWYKAWRFACSAKRSGGPPWLINTAVALQLSIFAFAFGRIALSLAYFDLIFTLFGLTIVIDKHILSAELEKHRHDVQHIATPLPAMTPSYFR